MRFDIFPNSLSRIKHTYPLCIEVAWSIIPFPLSLFQPLQPLPLSPQMVQISSLPPPQPPPAAPMAVSDPTAMMPQILGPAAGNNLMQPQPPPPPPPVVVTLSSGGAPNTLQLPPPPGQMNGGIPGILPPAAAPPPPVLLDQHHQQALSMPPPPPPSNGQIQMNGHVAHVPQLNGQQQHPVITSVPAPLPTTTMNGALHQMNGGLQLQMQPQQQQVKQVQNIASTGAINTTCTLFLL